MKTNYPLRNVVTVSISAVAVMLSLFSFVPKEGTKTAYVSLEKLYNDFEMKKELETKLDQVLQARKFKLDSLELKLMNSRKEINLSSPKEKELLIREYSYNESEYHKTAKRFEEDNIMLQKQYTEQIMKQLTQYVSDYGKKEGYKYVFGTAGDGNIMYASESENITEEVLVYVNKVYNGSKL